jgi:hypothetical protein
MGTHAAAPTASASPGRARPRRASVTASATVSGDEDRRGGAPRGAADRPHNSAHGDRARAVGRGDPLQMHEREAGDAGRHSRR